MLMRSNNVDYDYNKYFRSDKASYGCLNNNSTIAHMNLYMISVEHHLDVDLTFLLIDRLY